MESERGLLTNKGTIERAIWASKLALLCVGAISTATLFRAAVMPHVLHLALSTVPQIWVSSRTSSWASPLYIYLAVNFIIAAIALSSMTFRRQHHRNVPNTDPKPSFGNNFSHSSSVYLEKTSSWDRFHMVQEAKAYEESWTLEKDKVKDNDKDEDEDEDEIEVFNGGDEEGPPEEHLGEESSMDETWKAIMDKNQRRGVLGRSETMAAAARRLERAEGEEEEVAAAAAARKEMRKLATFSDRVSLIRDKSMSPEELNLRAEAFIKKVNNDMRLQRLESEQRYMDMVNRGL